MLPLITPAEEATRFGQRKNKARECHQFTSGTKKYPVRLKKCGKLEKNRKFIAFYFGNFKKVLNFAAQEKR